MIGDLARRGVCDGGMAHIRAGGGGRPDYMRCYSANKGGGGSNTERYHHKRIEGAVLDRVPFLVCEIASASDTAARLTVERDAARATQRMMDEDDPPKSVLAAIRRAEEEAAREDARADELSARIVNVEREAASAGAAHELTAEAIEAAFDSDADEDGRYAAETRPQQLLRGALWAVFCVPDGRKAIAFIKGGRSFQIEQDGDVHSLSQHLADG